MNLSKKTNWIATWRFCHFALPTIHTVSFRVNFFQKECIPVGSVPPARYHTGGGLPDRDLPGQRPPLETPGQRPPSQRPPQTQTPLDRDPWKETPWTETPWTKTPLDRDPPGQRPSPL